MDNNELKTLHQGNHLTMVARGNWEYVQRNTNKPAVGIVAITDENKVVLVEQFRPPVNSRVIEIPAGLSGDIPGAEDEALIEAAKRELIEETGYTAKHWQNLGGGFSSPGMTDETIELFLAEGLEKQHAGGGDASEDITIHEVPIKSVFQWLQKHKTPLDIKLLAALFAAEQYKTNLKGEK
ncbi:MAG: DNA mismatch repair protein MutT [Blastopirellula sp.]|nr:MAG: DNA mismatch repair protein MutT [Blastopirellula sp.]